MSSPMRNPEKILCIPQSVMETLARSDIHPPFDCWNRSTYVETYERLSHERALLTWYRSSFEAQEPQRER
eukprot:scaffold1220_cov312-Pavlova_lutheri.AAC.1